MRGPAAPPPGRLAEGLQPSLPPFTIAPMRKLLTLWDPDLRRLAERLPPMERTRAIQRWRLFPLLPTIPTEVLFQALGDAPIVTTCATVVVAGHELAHGLAQKIHAVLVDALHLRQRLGRVGEEERGGKVGRLVHGAIVALRVLPS